MSDCATCYGRKFVRNPDGWSPCPACYWASISTSYVRPIIRQADSQLPDAWRSKEPWPLQDRVETGRYDDFRYMVWQSLLWYHDRRLTYDYFEAWRLTEIQFEREVTEYTTLRDLKGLDLLVLVSGIADPPNSYTAPLVKYVAELRTMHGKPTWVYTKPAGRTDLRLPPSHIKVPAEAEPKPRRKPIF